MSVKELVEAVSAQHKQNANVVSKIQHRVTKKRLKNMLDDLFRLITSSQFHFLEMTSFIFILDRVSGVLSGCCCKVFSKRLYRMFFDKLTIAIGSDFVSECYSSLHGN
jgi:hypothetical protein